MTKEIRDSTERQKINVRRYLYKIEQNQWEFLVESQGGMCAICREAPPVAVDHDHQTGKIRGALCRKCNTGLGMFGDSAEGWERVFSYLRAEPASLPAPVRVERPRAKRHVCGKGNTCPGEKELRRMYVDERWIIQDMADLMNCNTGSVMGYLDRHEIPRRGRSMCGTKSRVLHHCGQGNTCPGEGELRRMYEELRMPVKSIAEALGLRTAGQLYHFLNMHGIERRTGR
ncbi:endonuclease VII domain-containing protein [Brevibacterium moorei]|uniref:endonuclease VII domain-containing protein n=1 Tax=Brevibacterium moorei TaxID=2968457 RepID=UPI00211C77CC|nr:endonuclease VII domain-containing protein [Brevibacterium sp. 68QC2CO]MCQ9384455.1 endonuclease VII domain-containing protein [Brevibacterium sp. 68QC2CO]